MNRRKIHNKTRALAIILCTLLFSWDGQCQSVHFENFSTKNGLPSNEVYHMYQDVNGYIWFATDHCISRFDGYSFETFGLKDGLTSNTVFRFYPQKNGEVWCSTVNNEFFYFDPKDYDFKSYEFNDQLSKIAANAINDDLLIEEDGTLHVGFIDKFGIISINSKGQRINDFEMYNEAQSVSVVSEVLPNNEQLGYITYKGTADYLKGDNNSIITIPLNEQHYHKAAAQGKVHLLSDATNLYLFNSGKLVKVIPFDHQIIGLGFSGKNQFWIGCQYGGLTLFDLQGNKTNSFLEDESVGCFLIDHEGGVWISTLTSGVYYTSSLSVRQYRFGSTPYVYNLSRNRQGQLLAGIYDGSMFRLENGAFNLFQTSNKKTPSFLQYYSSIDGELSLFGDDQMLNNRKVQGRCTSGIRKLSDELDMQPIVIGRRAFYIMDEGIFQEHISPQNLQDACRTEKGIYLAMNSGLARYDFKMGTFGKFENKHLQYRISDIDNWKSNCFIGATYGNGVVIVEKDEIWSITQDDGLTSDIVHEVYVQNDSIIWACTNSGLNRIQFKGNRNYEITAFTRFDGLMDNAVTDIEIVGNTVWVSTRSGVSSFPISLLKNEIEGTSYFLRLLKPKVNGYRKDNIEDLPYWQNKVEFNFQGISFKGKDKLRYRYKMIGLDEHWNYTSSRSVVYEALNPGSYTFILQVGMNSQWSSKTLKVPFEISPAFYMTTWFRLLIVGAIGALVYLFFKLRVLVYNRDLTRELLRHLLKRMKRKTDYFIVRENGNEVRISSADVLYVKSLGNYLEIYTTDEKVVIRERISKFLELVPDSIEYMQVQRSYIVRIDKIDKKGANSIFINGYEIKIGKTYLEVLSKISF